MKKQKVVGWLVGLALVSASPFASAAAIYTWDTIDLAGFTSISGRLVIDKLAYFDGHAAFEGQNLPGLSAWPTAEIHSLSMQVNGKDVSIFPRSGQPGLDWVFDIDVIPAEAGLAGGLYVNNTETEVWMGGGFDLWEIDFFNSDDYFAVDPCNPDISQWSEGCSGATGRWVATYTPVPEPGALALFAAGLIGLVALRRRYR